MLFTFRHRNDYRRIDRGNDNQNPAFGRGIHGNGNPNPVELSKSYN